MALNIDCIELLAKILEQNTFDEKLFNKYIKTKGGRGLLVHEASFGRDGHKIYIEEELKKVIFNKDYQDSYNFFLIKRNLNQLNMDIQYIKKNKDIIIEKAVKRVYKIVPKEVSIKIKIYLYGGGIDSGFTLNRKEVFINYANYIGKPEEFINIISHELYHSRKLCIENRIKFLFKMIFKTNRRIYEILGKTIEEGIACLIQHGPILKLDDKVSNLTKENILLSKEQFNLLNEILNNIRTGKSYINKIEKLNIYVLGYIIVTTIYNEEGLLILDDWTVNLEFKRIIERYAELCNMKGISSGFKNEILKWIIG